MIRHGLRAAIGATIFTLTCFVTDAAHRGGEVRSTPSGSTPRKASAGKSFPILVSSTFSGIRSSAEVGGHIGWGVLPAFRRQGIETQLLKHALEEAKTSGIACVLVTCDESNLGSIKVIEKCGGRLEDVTPAEIGAPPKRRYLIENP